MLLSSYFVLIIAPRSSRGTKHSQKNSGGAADGRAWPRDAWGQAHGRQPGIPACSWKTKPRQASAHRLFEARDRLCQGKKKKKSFKAQATSLASRTAGCFSSMHAKAGYRERARCLAQGRSAQAGGACTQVCSRSPPRFAGYVSDGVED